jgi:hypothetical protein
MTFCKPMATPTKVNLHSSKDRALQSIEEIDIMRGVPYQQAIGFFTYVMVCIRPNLTFAMGTISQHSSNPRPTH